MLLVIVMKFYQQIKIVHYFLTPISNLNDEEYDKFILGRSFYSSLGLKLPVQQQQGMD
ncbi:MAG: hypothetical protein R2837_04050 [Aliarcobacter sp.]